MALLRIALFIPVLSAKIMAVKQRVLTFNWLFHLAIKLIYHSVKQLLLLSSDSLL